MINESHEEKLIQKFIAIGLWSHRCKEKIECEDKVESVVSIDKVIEASDEGVKLLRGWEEEVKNMSQTEHTKRVATLLLRMIAEGENPAKQDGKRSDQEQARLFRIGRTFDAQGNVIFEDKTKTVTNCDGVHNISGHQRNVADDILFFSQDDKILLKAPSKGWAYWHSVWTELGGLIAISFDPNHFESPRV